MLLTILEATASGMVLTLASAHDAMILPSNAISTSGQVMCGLWLASISQYFHPGSLLARSPNWRNTSPGPLFLAYRSALLGVDVVPRRRWPRRLEPDLLLEGLDRLRPAAWACPGNIFRRGVGGHRIDRQFPAIAILGRAGPHVAFALWSRRSNRLCPSLGAKASM